MESRYRAAYFPEPGAPPHFLIAGHVTDANVLADILQVGMAPLRDILQ